MSIRGLIKASHHYNNLAAREDWLKFCDAHGIDPDSIEWRTMSHKKIDKHIANQWVRKMLKLVALDPVAQKAVASGKIKSTAIAAVSKLTTEQQRKVVKDAGDGAVTVPRKKESSKPTAKQFREAISTWATDTTINESIRYFAEQVEKYLNGEIKEIKIPAKLTK